jgi:hypothetical protein
MEAVRQIVDERGVLSLEPFWRRMLASAWSGASDLRFFNSPRMAGVRVGMDWVSRFGVLPSRMLRCTRSNTRRFTLSQEKL